VALSNVADSDLRHALDLAFRLLGQVHDIRGALDLCLFTQIHKELEEASTSCGASWLKTFVRVTLPLMAPGLLIGFLFILSLSFRVLGLPVMISHVNTRMMPSFIFSLYDEGKYEVLSALGF
jgi:ABC-type Fe3+ transport system permease subunit